MFNKTRIPSARLLGSWLAGCLLVISSAVVFVPAPVNAQPAQGEPATSIEDTKRFITEAYKNLPVDAGVFNDGQAALWDLDIIDHYHYFGPAERAKGYKPKQPISFSHITHVQRNKMECQYCHWSVTKSAFAAIPEVQTCVGCHKFVQGRTDFQKQEIAKLLPKNTDGTQATWNDMMAGKIKIEDFNAVPWVKVHVMPAHVNFNHKRHVKAGLSCQECHGQVPNMDQVQRVSSMKMGWCISCHRMKGTSIDCWTCHK